MSRKAQPPPKPNETIRYYPRIGPAVDYTTHTTAVVWSPAPRPAHWWVRVGQTFVEVYRRQGAWFESPTPGEEPRPKARKVKPVMAGSVPLFEAL